MQRHVDIGGEDGDEEQDQAPGGAGACFFEAEQGAEEDFGEAADLDERRRVRQVGRHDFEIEFGPREMHASGDDEQKTE